MSDESKREQAFPDGTVLPIPDHPRFVWRRGQWCWLDDDGEIPLVGIRAGWPLKWHACCALAAMVYRHAIVLTTAGRDLDDAEAAWVVWRDEFETADAESRDAWA